VVERRNERCTELPGLVGADSSSERDYTKEELAAIKARIDEQLERERAELEAQFAQQQQEEAVALANSDSWLG
jgi:hypothetical protein